MHVIHLTGQGLVSAWERAESARQLEDILSTPVQVRVSPQQIPLTTQVSLQSILDEWDFGRQRPVVQQKLDLLEALRLRASHDSARLVDDYRQTLGLYLQRRGKLRGSSRKTDASPAARLIVSDTVRRLNELDAQRQALRKQSNAPPAQLTVSP